MNGIFTEHDRLYSLLEARKSQAELGLRSALDQMIVSKRAANHAIQQANYAYVAIVAKPAAKAATILANAYTAQTENIDDIAQATDVAGAAAGIDPAAAARRTANQAIINTTIYHPGHYPGYHQLSDSAKATVIGTKALAAAFEAIRVVGSVVRVAVVERTVDPVDAQFTAMAKAIIAEAVQAVSTVASGFPVWTRDIFTTRDHTGHQGGTGDFAAAFNDIIATIADAVTVKDYCRFRYPGRC